MDWTQAFTIIGIIAGFFVFMMNRMDSNQKQTAEDFKQVNEKIESIKKDLEQKITEDIRDLKTDMNQRISDMKIDMNQRLATIEGYLVPRKIFHIQENDLGEELKEN